MEIILLTKIAKLGDLGDIVHVKPGFARNFLFPQQKAVPASEAHRTEFASRREELERAAQTLRAEADARGQHLAEHGALAIEAQVSEDGRLYGSVGVREIAEVAEQQGLEINKNEITLPDGPLRETGEHGVEVRLHPDLVVTMTVIVSAA